MSSGNDADGTSRILTLVFTDLVDSTALKTQRGDQAVGALITRHRAHVRRLAAESGGRIIDWAGDGCFLTFETPSAAVLFALRLQQVHRDEPGVYLECEGRDLASLARAYVELGEPERAREVAQRAVILVQERGSRIEELENVVALTRAEVALGHDDAVDPLLARAETLSAAMGAVRFHPQLAEIRAERARRRGDQATWRTELTTAHRLFAETGATGHAERVSRELSAVRPQAKER